MGLWGTTTAADDKPKFLPVDSNAAGSTGAREHAIAVKGGWGLTPGLAASGNDNKDAQPEVLVCVKNLAEFMGSASIIGIDWTDATVGNVGTFDITVTFDEAVDITSAAWSANQTITNKAYILLSRVGKTDMVEDNTMACMYYAGSGSNQITFRGTAATNAAAAFLAFNGAGVGDAGIVTGINFDGSANISEEDGASAIGVRLESGTAAAGTAGGSLIANGSAGKFAVVNGAITTATTALVLNGNVGTIVVGDVVTVKDTSTASITDADGNTGLSTDNSLTVTVTNGSTSVTLSESITIADDVDLLFHTNGGEEIIADALALAVAGPLYNTRSDITTVTRVGADSSVAVQLESATTDLDGVAAHESNAKLAQESGNASDNDSDDRNAEVEFGDPLVVEIALDDAATYVASGSTSGTAYVLKGVDVAAA